MKRFRDVPWQRNLRHIPSEIIAKIDASPDVEFVAGVVKTISISDVHAGVYAHIGMTIVNSAIAFKERVLPDVGMGMYSQRNRKGWEVVRRDLPMVTRAFTFEAPNYGDWSNGTHDVTQYREVYQRDSFEPPEMEIIVSKLRDDQNGAVVFKFTVDCKFDRKMSDYKESLLFALNLLQENVGVADVLRPDARTEELLSTLVLDWEIFPPGSVEEVVQRMTSGRGVRPSTEQESLIRERVALFSKLKPKRYILGRGGMNHYVGALYSDDLAVFENTRYGNALYVLQEKWEEISQRSRLDLLRSHDVPFERFVHCQGWAQRFKQHIDAEKRRRGIN
jgi:hypothetical protein